MSKWQGVYCANQGNPVFGYCETRYVCGARLVFIGHAKRSLKYPAVDSQLRWLYVLAPYQFEQTGPDCFMETAGMTLGQQSAASYHKQLVKLAVPFHVHMACVLK